MPKLHFGSRGGCYYKKNGRKVYVKNKHTKKSSFGMDYAAPGVLGGLGQGYVQPSLMYFGDSNFGWNGAYGGLYNGGGWNDSPQGVATSMAFGNVMETITTQLNQSKKTADEFYKEIWKLVPGTRDITDLNTLANKLIEYPGLVIDDAGAMVGTGVDFTASTLRNAGQMVADTADSGTQMAYDFINAVLGQKWTLR